MRVFNGKITPQFYHAYPSLMAFFNALAGGIHGALAVNPLLNTLSICLLYRLAALWTGHRGWGALAAIWLLLFPGQIWQAKFSTAELLTQVFLLGGLGCFLRWESSPGNRTIDAVLAAASLAMAQLTRYDTVMLLLGISPILAFYTEDPRFRKGLWSFFLTFIPFSLFWAFHQTRVAPFYSPLGSKVFIAFGCGIALTLISLLFGRFSLTKTVVRSVRVPLLTLLTTGWYLWMGFNWFIRPTLPNRTHITTQLIPLARALELESVMDSLLGPSRVSMLYLESLFHPLGLGWILLFAPVLWWTARGPVRAAWAVSGAAIMLVLTWEPLNDLFMMWVSRRFIPVVIPWMILGGTLGAATCARKLRTTPRTRRLVPVPAIIVFLLISLRLPLSSFMALNREWPGAIHWFEQVAEVLPGQAVLYTDQPGFGAPLRFIWDIHAFELRRQDAGMRDDLLDHVRKCPPEAPTYFLTTADLTDRPEWEIASRHPFRSSILAHHRTRAVRATKSRGGDFILYRLRSSGESK